MKEPFSFICQHSPWKVPLSLGQRLRTTRYSVQLYGVPQPRGEHQPIRAQHCGSVQRTDPLPQSRPSNPADHMQPCRMLTKEDQKKTGQLSTPVQYISIISTYYRQ